uniref:Uncharacterized protein n=1 Tax=Ananas comosus var. bracteatus TaxID=296719 RepID=A0A6V7QI34_ANACO|nr:unnamed protein product [Ananas comosus var. bracteatus]
MVNGKFRRCLDGLICEPAGTVLQTAGLQCMAIFVDGAKKRNCGADKKLVELKKPLEKLQIQVELMLNSWLSWQLGRACGLRKKFEPSKKFLLIGVAKYPGTVPNQAKEGSFWRASNSDLSFWIDGLLSGAPFDAVSKLVRHLIDVKEKWDLLKLPSRKLIVGAERMLS